MRLTLFGTVFDSAFYILPPYLGVAVLFSTS